MKRALVRAREVPPEAGHGSPKAGPAISERGGLAPPSTIPCNLWNPWRVSHRAGRHHIAPVEPVVTHRRPARRILVAESGVVAPLPGGRHKAENIGSRFSKRSQMMAAAKSRNRRFPEESADFDAWEAWNQIAFLRNEPK